MGSAGQLPLMILAWHRLNNVLYRRLLLVGLLSCVCAFPLWAEERPTPKSCGKSPFFSRRRSATDAAKAVGTSRPGDCS